MLLAPLAPAQAPPRTASGRAVARPSASSTSRWAAPSTHRASAAAWPGAIFREGRPSRPPAGPATCSRVEKRRAARPRRRIPPGIRRIRPTSRRAPRTRFAAHEAFQNEGRATCGEIAKIRPKFGRYFAESGRRWAASGCSLSSSGRRSKGSVLHTRRRFTRFCSACSKLTRIRASHTLRCALRPISNIGATGTERCEASGSAIHGPGPPLGIDRVALRMKRSRTRAAQLAGKSPKFGRSRAAFLPNWADVGPQADVVGRVPVGEARAEFYTRRRFTCLLKLD